MAVHNDFNGLWATIQGIRFFHSEAFDDIEILVIDNSNDGHTSEAIRQYLGGHYKDSGHYLRVVPKQSTSLRSVAFMAATTEYVMCIDSHIFLAPGSLQKLCKFLKTIGVSRDLFHGPLLNESGHLVATHMNPAIRGENFGTWGTMPGDLINAMDDNAEAFQIPGHGMGLWVARKDNWPGFHPGYVHFGGEEMIIHEKYRQRGDYVWCLPFLRWQHRFGHVGGASYTNTVGAKYRNFLIGFHETGLPLKMIHDYFGSKLSAELRKTIQADVAAIFPKGPAVLPPGYTPFLGYPLRINDYCGKDSHDYRPFEKPIFAT